jgi:hypothetical protein
MTDEFNIEYKKTLGEFEHDSEKPIQECCNITLDIQDLKKVFHSILDESPELLRSQLYARALYEMQPTSLMDIFMIGHMFGTIEEKHKINE